jgi:hypothetical protein
MCRSLTVSNLALAPLEGWLGAPPASFRATGETGVSVRVEAALPATAAPGDALRVPLMWSFETARAATDTRFVHVLDEHGELVAQQDNPLGAIPAGERRAEWVTLSLPPDLPPGDYRVFAGWYTLPDVINFCRLEGDGCAGNEALLGTVRVD